jgi:hypothetical protein
VFSIEHNVLISKGLTSNIRFFIILWLSNQLRREGRKMTHEANNDIRELCALIAKEQDRQKFLELVTQLNDRLAARDQELKKASGQEEKTPAATA